MNYCLGEGRFDFKGPGIRDCTSGFRRYSRRAFSEIAGISLRSKAFDFHLEALDVVNRTGGSIREIPIQYNYTNSSFNLRVLRVAGTFVASLLRRKWS
jgi:dolichol-phosphate mannosyltransferase